MTGELQFHSREGISQFFLCDYDYVQTAILALGHLHILLFEEGCFHGGKTTRA